MTIRDLTADDLDWVLEINREHEALLSVLDRDGLERLFNMATLARGIEGEAFMLAMDAGADYESWNFQWFRNRYPAFLYVDRVAVASAAAGGGQGKRLYADFCANAVKMAYSMVCAEVNSVPPNHASLLFHDKQGFETVGEEAVPGREKSVRFFAKNPADAAFS